MLLEYLQISKYSVSFLALCLYACTHAVLRLACLSNSCFFFVTASLKPILDGAIYSFAVHIATFTEFWYGPVTLYYREVFQSLLRVGAEIGRGHLFFILSFSHHSANYLESTPLLFLNQSKEAVRRNNTRAYKCS